MMIDDDITDLHRFAETRRLSHDIAIDEAALLQRIICHVVDLRATVSTVLAANAAMERDIGRLREEGHWMARKLNTQRWLFWQVVLEWLW